MGISIWQIFILVLPILLFVVAFFTTSRDTFLNRMGYFVRLLVLIVAGTGLVLLTSTLLAESAAGAIIMLVLGIVIGLMNLRFQIMRLQDIGWSRYFALLSYVPIANLVFLLVLLFVPGGQRPVAEVFS
ncbi:DUF805 domain-containing protein [Roseibium sp.]|uniref:DUF805 domain-containing protein n=1 Tax=Roseibium sp. TaxID=1936156 RepID=UPI003BB18DE0